MMENLVEIKDVNFSYDVRPVLKRINMSVPRGKLVSIMGLSGCGKTTLLRLIGGALRPTTGEVRVGGTLMNNLDQHGLYEMRRKMGMLFQFGALFTDLPAYDNVAFQMREHTDLPESMIHDLVMMKLNAVGLRGAQHMMPSELSGGMARRVALARVLALDPMLIMYDEPFTGLDPISMGVISELIRQLNAALGATSIIVTHDVQETLKIVEQTHHKHEHGSGRKSENALWIRLGSSLQTNANKKRPRENAGEHGEDRHAAKSRDGSVVHTSVIRKVDNPPGGRHTSNDRHQRGGSDGGGGCQRDRGGQDPAAGAVLGVSGHRPTSRRPPERLACQGDRILRKR